VLAALFVVHVLLLEFGVVATLARLEELVLLVLLHGNLESISLLSLT